MLKKVKKVQNRAISEARVSDNLECVQVDLNVCGLVQMHASVCVCVCVCVYTCVCMYYNLSIHMKLNIKFVYKFSVPCTHTVTQTCSCLT